MILNDDANNSLLINTIIPVKPIKTPNTCFFNNSSPKTKTLINNVNSGVNETITAVIELEISVSAKANK